ncbi:MAG: hypothetical protein FJ147_14650 [Deltaproteobacteria bacterium]|nr:hypothetical protein [Deltaproteobacteria bacterium]
MSSSPRIHRNHNVYILGAGFSCDAGLPVVKDFLNRMRDSIDWLHENNRGEEARAVERIIQFRLEAAAAAYRAYLNIEHIEELFSLASAWKGNELTEQMTTAIAATLDYAKLTFPEPSFRLLIDSPPAEVPKPWQQITGDDTVPRNQSPHRSPYRVPYYHLYAGLLSGKLCHPTPDMENTVITFNYDTLLEDGLTDIDVPFDYHLPSSDKSMNSQTETTSGRPLPLRVLKLHGSMNWGTQKDKKTDHLTIYKNYSQLREQGAEVVLIPPTWRKVFGGALTSIWDAALEALSSATRIVLIGFSIPPTDMHFKYLLAAGLCNNVSLRQIEIINPAAQSAEKNLFKILRKELSEQVVINTKTGELKTL